MALPSTMKALLLKNDGYSRDPSGTALEAMEPYVEQGTIEVPEPGPSQVLVKVGLASINPSDVMFLKGLYGQPRRQGQPAGFEGVGEVVAAGAEAQGLIGKRVAFATGLSNWGSWADYAVAEAGASIPIMDGVRDEDAAAMIVNPLTALAMLGIVKDEGEKAFVVTAGASQLCKLIISVAKDEGYRPIAIVRRDDQIDLLKSIGAAHVLNAEAADFDAKLAEVMGQEKPRIFLDAVTGPLAAKIFNAMGKRARWIVYGRLDPEVTPIIEPGQMIFMHKKIEGFWLTEWMRSAGNDKRMAAVIEAQKRFSDGRWKTDVTAIVPLEEAVSRVAGELAKPNGKVFIRP
ncbi:zinc-binding dehydrogenase [Aliihoeflea aestuarii]|jgi:NADPH:quinone reductase-like Zn-dependent oxidoreductase|uniref:zinc-binding dehydrogenase n=1 Tax=Aliihoeflea aestuarii TaxID=453840 RepID=UPI002093BE9F|nr:zinc-binding dehydrogenase [Aliihoeflea aestuarii]MCO6391903.1 zinc-binding dehydrogenase [Aliihoeflea aestuarii]